MYERGRGDVREGAWRDTHNGDCWVGVTLLTFIQRSPAVDGAGDDC